MKLPPWLVERIINKAKKTPYIHLDGYMNRWWLLKPIRDRETVHGRSSSYWLPNAIRVHEILRSDMDRHLHNHPFDYCTILLKNGYVEETPGQKFKDYPEGSVLFRRADSYHRLHLNQGIVTTLFIMSAKRQDWGFMTDKGFIFWRVYLDDWTTA